MQFHARNHAFKIYDMPALNEKWKQVLSEVEAGYRMPCPPGNPNELYQIMLDCWKAVGACGGESRRPLNAPFSPQEANARPTFETLQWRMEDFFLTSEANYNDIQNF